MTTTRVRRFVTPDADASAGDLGQLVTHALTVQITARHPHHDDDDPALPLAGYVTGRPGLLGQITVTWPDGRQTFGSPADFQAVRVTTTAERSTALVFPVYAAVLPRYEVRTLAFDPSTGAPLGHELIGYDDEPLTGDPETVYVDRWQIARIQGPECPHARAAAPAAR